MLIAVWMAGAALTLATGDPCGICKAARWKTTPPWSNRPFSSIFGEMLDLADNEYQKTLHEVFYTT